MSIKKLKPFILPCLLLFILFISVILLLNSLLQKPSVQQYIIKQISRSIGYELSARDIEVSFWGGIGISADDFEAKSTLGPEKISAPMVRVIFDPYSLMKGEIIPSSVFLSRPRIELPAQKFFSSYIEANGEDSVSKSSILKRMAVFPEVTLESAEIIINDYPFRIENLYLDISQRSPVSAGFDFRSHGEIAFSSEKADFKLKGSIIQEDSSKSPSVHMTLESDRIPLSLVPSSHYLYGFTGFSKAKIDINGTLDRPLSVKGKVIASNTGFFIANQETKKGFTFKFLNFDFDSFFSASLIEISSMKLVTQDFSLQGKAFLGMKDKSDPYLDLSIESSTMASQVLKKAFPTPVLPEFVENRIFPVFSGGNLSVGQFTLKGTINQIYNLNLPENAGALFLKIEGENLEVLKDTTGVSFRDVSGELSIDSGNLVVSNLKGKFGSSDINDASLHVSRLYSDAPVFKALVKGKFALDDLKHQLETDIMPDYIRNQLGGVDQVSGNLEACLEVDYEEAWKYPRIQKSEFKLNDCSISHEKIFLPVKIQDALLKITEGGECDLSAKGFLGKSDFVISGSTENLLAGAGINLAIHLDMNEIVEMLYADQKIPFRFKSALDSYFVLNKKDGAWSCHGEADLQGFGMETPSFLMEPGGTQNRLVFDLDLQSGEKLYIKNLLCNFNKSALNISGYYDLQKRDLFKLKSFSNNFSLEDLGIFYTKGNVHAKGLLSFWSEITAFPQNPLKTTANGEIKAKNISFFLSGLPSQIKDLNFKTIFKGKDILINSFKMRVGNNPVKISGNLSGWQGLKGTLKINSEYINVTDLIKNYADKLFSKTKKRSFAGTSITDSISNQRLNKFINDSEINLNLNVNKGKWKTILFGPLKAECVFRSGNFIIKNSVFEKEHGVLAIKGHMLTGKSPEVLFSGYIKMEDQPVSDYLNALGIKEYLDGIITMEGVFYTRGRDKEEMLSSLTGSASFLIENGKIKKSNIILHVLEFLSLQNVFTKKQADNSGEGFYFKNISGEIAINEGVFESNSIVMNSPVFNGAFKGGLNLCNDQLDFDIGVQPLGTIDYLISRIPIIGYILAGKEKSILVYYFKVTGPISNPDVRYVPLKNWGTGVAGFFERIFLTPSRIIKGMTNGK